MSNSLHLNADGLLSKWGFGDGDILWDWWWDQHDEEPPGSTSQHDALRSLVRTHLIPEVERAGHTIEVYDIETNHNPIRARLLDGQEVDDYAGGEFDPPIGVVVSEADIVAALTSNDATD